MLRILHISDIHCGPFFRPEAAEALLAIATQLRPDVVVASGDFTQRAKAGQFAEARAFLDRLPPVPCLVVPGNHDVPLYRVWERCLNPYGLYRRHISGELESVWRNHRAVIVALNSTSPLTKITHGRITARQLDLCAEAFRDAGPDRYRIVVAHHQFAPAPFPGGAATLGGVRAALDRFTALKVDLVLGGHMHRAYIGNSLDVFAGRDREHGIVVVQCGTSTSRRGRGRERAKNTFNLLELESETIHVTHYMHFADANGFVPIGRHTFPRPRRPWLE